MSKQQLKLTKVQKFYVDGHPDSDPKTLAKELGVPTELIEKHRSNKPVVSVDNLLARNTKYGAVVMTQEASSVADSTRKRSRDNSSFIHKPKG